MVRYSNLFHSNDIINDDRIKKEKMKNLQRCYPILLAFISFLFSVTLWFMGYKEEGMFVGIWVPSILACGCFINTLKK